MFNIFIAIAIAMQTSYISSRNHHPFKTPFYIHIIAYKPIYVGRN